MQGAKTNGKKNQRDDNGEGNFGEEPGLFRGSVHRESPKKRMK